MKINKSVDVDLNILSPQKHIRIHEGDVDSVDILIGVSVDDETVDLDGVTIKYDATINNYLAEQDANGSVVDDKISIPVTQNMTAMSGLLLIDVRMIQSDQILFTQTICATVEKAVVNGSTYIDLNKITIIQRMNALEEKMDYIEELVENFDTSKLIVSTNRPPSGAPPEVDVDLLRVGDTWILSGENIVYKLVEAQYNYQPVPSAEPYHKFTWQPLNERYGVGNSEPPETITYQEVVYTIDSIQWSWLPVPEYFKGDHYQMQIELEKPTYYICKEASPSSTGVYTYTWREEGGAGDVSSKMSLAPLNPTAEQIAALPVGQVYGDAVNDSIVLKAQNKLIKSVSENWVIGFTAGKQKKIQHLDFLYRYSTDEPLLSGGDFAEHQGIIYYLSSIETPAYPTFYKYSYTWWRQPSVVYRDISIPPEKEERIESDTYFSHPSYFVNDILITNDNSVYICVNNKELQSVGYSTYYMYEWKKIYNAYTKTEIGTMLGDVESLLSEV